MRERRGWDELGWWEWGHLWRIFLIFFVFDILRAELGIVLGKALILLD